MIFSLVDGRDTTAYRTFRGRRGEFLEPIFAPFSDHKSVSRRRVADVLASCINKPLILLIFIPIFSEVVRCTACLFLPPRHSRSTHPQQLHHIWYLCRAAVNLSFYYIAEVTTSSWSSSKFPSHFFSLLLRFSGARYAVFAAAIMYRN